MLFLRWYLWLAPNLLGAVCAIVFWRREFHRRFPAFTAFLMVQAGGFLTLLVCDVLIGAGRSSLSTYRWIVVAAECASAFVQFAVLYELAGYLLRSRPSAVTTLKSFYRLTFAGLLLVSSACAALLPQSGIGRVIASFQVLDFLVSFISIGLLITLLLFARALHIAWRSLPAGIALGFGINACADFVSSPLLQFSSVLHFIPTDMLTLAANHVAVVVWSVYILLPRVQAACYTGELLKAAQLDQWNEQMQEIQR